MSLFGPSPNDRPDNGGNSGTGNDGRHTDGEPRRRESDRGWHWEPPLAAHHKHPDVPYINRIDLVPPECRQAAAPASFDSPAAPAVESAVDDADESRAIVRSAPDPAGWPVESARSGAPRPQSRLAQLYDDGVLLVLLAVSGYFVISGFIVGCQIVGALLARLVQLFAHL